MQSALRRLVLIVALLVNNKTHTMKKIISLSFFLLMSIALFSQAKTYYTLHDAKDESIKAFESYTIDVKANKFKFNNIESSSDANLTIKNYKKSGNKESFDLYMEDGGYSTRIFFVELAPNSNGKEVISFSVYNENSKVPTDSYVLGTKEEQASNERAQMASSKAPAKPSVKNPASKESNTTEDDKKESGVKKVVDKGLGVFKKKK